MNEDDQKKDTLKAKKTVKKTVKKTAAKSASKPVKTKAPRKTALKTVASETAEAKTNAKAKTAKSKSAAKSTKKSISTKAGEADAKPVKPRAKRTYTKKLKTTSEEITIPSVSAAVISTVPESEKAITLSPVFKELAEPKLPALREENRAFLQIQSPTRLFFYWSLKQNAEQKLRKTLGSRANDYFFAVRLINLRTNHEEIHHAGSRGSWWFNNVEADTQYRAEVGFYAHNRPFIRLVFSNRVRTPRTRPSANTSYQNYFAVTANQFADVLDMAGFSQDAFDVYLAGDTPQLADSATQKALVQLIGNDEVDFSTINLNELRYILFALASGVSLVTLRESVSSQLFAFLAKLAEENPNALTEERVILALEEFFGMSLIEGDQLSEEVDLPKVFGASLINFPKGMRQSRSNLLPSNRPLREGELSPISSFSLR